MNEIYVLYYVQHYTVFQYLIIKKKAYKHETKEREKKKRRGHLVGVGEEYKEENGYCFALLFFCLFV